MNQKQAFLASEGDQYYQRNKSKLTSATEMAAHDEVLAGIKALDVKPSHVLEIGCANGWRLEALRTMYGCECHGIDPSAEGVNEGKSLFPEIKLQQGTADTLPFLADTFDLVIFGFCLYLCDRKDLFMIAHEADRVLKDRGHIAIFDFHPPFAYRNEYKHLPGISCYKMNYANLFLWNPVFVLASQQVFNHGCAGEISSPNDRVSVSILYKHTPTAYPENPFTTKS